MAKVSIVGAGMMTNPGVAAKMFEALTQVDIPVFVVSTSEIKVSCLVPGAGTLRPCGPCTQNLSWIRRSDLLFAENMVSL